MRRHQEKYFRDGLAKVGLETGQSDVIRCAKYHYFSNTLGGLPMHYVEESPDKVWIRYLAPYWMGDGPTQPAAGAAALGAAFGRAPYLGWHANNGSYLGNDRLIFVQTQSLADGDPWDGGYFTLRDPASPDRRTYLRRTGERGPRPDPEHTPQLPHATWPQERRSRALRNYAVGFTASRYATLADLVGITEAARVVEQAWVITLAQRGQGLRDDFAVGGAVGAAGVGALLASFALVTGDTVEMGSGGGATTVDRTDVKLWRHENVPIPEIDAAIGRAWTRVLGGSTATVACRLAILPDGYRWELHD